MRKQCPRCHKTFGFTVESLSRFKNGIFCSRCHFEFDRLDLLEEAISLEQEEANAVKRTSQTKPKASRLFGGLTVLLLIFFIIQAYYFEGEYLIQNKDTRPWVSKICSYVGCQLPTYKKLSEFTLLHGSFEAVENYFVFKTVLTNQAAFEQETPSIKLILIDYTGSVFAERTFLPKDYTNTVSGLIKPDESVEISIAITAPSTKVGGYRFELN